MHPILYEVPTPWGGLAIFSYGVCMALAALAGWYAWARRSVSRARLYVSAWIVGLIGGKVDWAASYGDGIFEGGLTLSGLVAGVAFATWVRGTAWRGGAMWLMAAAAAHALGQWLHSPELHPLALYEVFCACVLAVAAHRQPSRSLAWVALLVATHVALEPLRPSSSAIAYVLPVATMLALGMAAKAASKQGPRTTERGSRPEEA